jgi:hypothetical protein
LLTWDGEFEKDGGAVKEKGDKVELPLTTQVYWSPLGDGGDRDSREVTIRAAILNKNVRVAEKQMKIKYDASDYLYTVVRSSDVLIVAPEKNKSQSGDTGNEINNTKLKGQNMENAGTAN